VIAFFADDAAPSLIGAQTLETFGLGVDPLGRRLVPVDAYLASGVLPAFHDREVVRTIGLPGVPVEIISCVTNAPKSP
jgi:hypothetical protein